MPENMHVVDLLPGYALGCLDELEQAQVAEHLTSCDLCRHELQAYQGVVDTLPYAVVVSDPPAALKASIMQRVRKEQPADLISSRPSAWHRLTRFFQRAAPAWGLASLALVILLALSNMFLWQRLNKIESAFQANPLTVMMNGTDFAPQATGVIIFNQDSGFATLVVDDLPVLSPEQQYQLWLVKDGERTNGGVFSVDDRGYGIVQVSSPAPLTSFTGFGITIEPAGGSPGPTGDKVLGGEL